ncbi:hypothetical protein KU306_16845 (plasmid) [Haloferax larsenii]|uniref:Transcriptional regulator n=1 Tax=Haloferax larsenii TaxID=302484 RepID=A0ABY5RK94_HALLR|nr:hypothetical protein [Haloferax larsenii]UVE51990.1 hypothetical protein KU306_16845 [Haloferax larsenii]
MVPPSKKSQKEKQYDTLQFFTSSPTRYHILAALEQCARNINELEKAVDSHRTTLRRNIRKLVKRGWVDEDTAANQYRITPAGSRLKRLLDLVFDELRKVRQIKSVFSSLPKDIGLTPEEIENNRISVSSQRDPFSALNTLINLIMNSDMIKIYTPSLNPQLLSTLINRESLEELELISTKSAFRTVEQSVINSLKEPEKHRVVTATKPPMYGVCLLSDNASLITYNEKMHMSSIVVSDGTNQLFDWVNQRYDSIKMGSQS